MNFQQGDVIKVQGHTIDAGYDTYTRTVIRCRRPEGFYKVLWQFKNGNVLVKRPGSKPPLVINARYVLGKVA